MLEKKFGIHYLIYESLKPADYSTMKEMWVLHKLATKVLARIINYISNNKIFYLNNIFYMKKIIQKKLYDTEISKEILKISNKLEITNISYFEETLYKTESGKYFIYGKGGPQSKFGIKEGNITFVGNDIWLVKKEDILFWVEYNFKYFSQENIEIILTELSQEISIG